MPIRRYLQNEAVFTPEAISAMNKALADTVEILGIGSDEIKRQTIAKFIIWLAQEEDSLDADALRDGAVTALGGIEYRDIPVSRQSSELSRDLLK
jgi:hypothetical protein